MAAGEPSSFTKWTKQTDPHQFQTQILNDNTDVDRRRIQLAAPLAADIPVIDVRRFVSATDAELSDLRSALSSWGCLQVVNHGIETSLLDQVRRISREFFHLPTTEKQKYATHGGEDEGYSTDVLAVDDELPDWSDNLGLRIFPEDRRKPKYWPQNPDSFKEVMVDYTRELRRVEEEILKLMAKSLTLGDEKSFVKKSSAIYAQFNYYPPYPNPDRVLGLREHADASMITILLQDDRVGGLQVLKDGAWFSVPLMPHALFVFAGDQLEIMSNGIFKSAVHRVTRVSSETERCTVAVFSSPDYLEEVGPLDELVDGERPRMFNSVTNYIGFYYPYFYKGKRAIDALRI